jgi:hypothetical protein
VSNSFEFIGYNGTGNYNQTGGTNTSPSIMYIGFGSGAHSWPIWHNGWEQGGSHGLERAFGG